MNIGGDFCYGHPFFCISLFEAPPLRELLRLHSLLHGELILALRGQFYG